MTANGFIAAISGDTEAAGALSIAAHGALYAAALEPKPKKKPEELLPAAPADRGTRRRLTKSEDEETIITINRSGRSTYLEEKSVSTSGATPVVLPIGHDER
jgi:hypothetical protein